MSVVAVVAAEPVLRVRSMLASVAAQRGCAPIEVVVAAPPADHVALHTHLRPGGAVDRVVLVPNPSGRRTAGLNRAVARATGAVIVRVDARSRLAPDHVRRCVARLDARPDIGVVGGHQIPSVSDEGVVAAGIGRALRNHRLLGGAPYRVPEAWGPVDTVYLGAFRRRDLLARRFDERLTANEDFELCARFRAAGAQVWLEPGLDVDYEPRATLPGLARQYRAFGAAKVAQWRTTGERPAPRQRRALVAGAAGAGLAVLLAARHPRLLPVAAVAGVGACLVADRRTDPEPRPVAVRLAAVAAHATIQASWLAGVVGAAVRRREASGDGEHPLERDAGLLGGDGIDDDLVHDLAAGQ